MISFDILLMREKFLFNLIEAMGFGFAASARIGLLPTGVLSSALRL